MAARLRARQPIGVLPRVVVERRQDDVELLEDGVLEIEPAIRQDVDLDAVEDRHPRKALAQLVDLVALVRDVVARQRPRGGSARRVIGDGHVLVAERVAALDHRLERRRGRRCRSCACAGRRGCRVASTSAGRPPDAAASISPVPCRSSGGDERQSEARVERVFAGVRSIRETAALHLGDVRVGTGGAKSVDP